MRPQCRRPLAFLDYAFGNEKINKGLKPWGCRCQGDVFFLAILCDPLASVRKLLGHLFQDFAGASILTGPRVAESRAAKA